ncbi:hypothetical protein BGZ97_005282 [Linnemannia gamsii]|uniref:Uncharacterized protein n=1 Tax=Linnemannia gamsii TaxID=64522 RepID=A0A9P6UFC5_9FUNG|nr:hypothetical protein BGZ97_005282 [Linnemannia gamsii]
MRWTLSAILIAALATVGTSAPLFTLSGSGSYQQLSFTRVARCASRPPRPPRNSDCGITYIPPEEGPTSSKALNDQMQNTIDSEMEYKYHPEKYREALKEALCQQPTPGYKNMICNVTILEAPTVQIIPAQPISQRVVCTTQACTVRYSVTQTVSTTHSTSVGFSGTAGAKPFGLGMEFTGSTGYEFSSTTEKATQVGYDFQLIRGESGYVALVGVQVSSRARFDSCPCELQINGRPSWRCKVMCESEENWTRQEGYHESIIKQNGGVKGIVSFIYT